MIKFPSIESFHHIVRGIRYHANKLGIEPHLMPPELYTGTVKLHGSNAGVCVHPDNTVSAQSRNHVLSISNTNAGWFTFVADPTRTQLFIRIVDELMVANGIDQRAEPVTIFGEWVGSGIQSGAAVCQCPRHFVIFDAVYGTTSLNILNITSDHALQVYHINEIPSFELTVDMAHLEDVSAALNEVTERVEQQCPWACAMFGVKGVGEGIVWRPKDDPGNSNRWFKTKGDKHKARNNPNKNVAPIDLEKVKNIDEAVSIILTENRMAQMVNDNNLELIRENIGPFLKALAADCIKEESDLLIANNLEWKDVVGKINTIAKNWFTNQITLHMMNHNN